MIGGKRYLSKKDFSKLFDQSSNYLSVDVRRGNVIVEPDDTIDTENDTNIAYLTKKLGKLGKTLQQVLNPQTENAPQPRTKTRTKANAADKSDTVGEGDEPDQPTELMTVAQALKQTKHYEALKKKLESELLALKKEKMQGEVVPTEPISVLFFQFKQMMLSQQKLTYQKFLNEVSHKYDIAADDIAYYKGFFIKELNTSVADASDNFVKSLEAVLNEYAVSRGRGEHD